MQARTMRWALGCLLIFAIGGQAAFLDSEVQPMPPEPPPRMPPPRILPPPPPYATALARMAPRLEIGSPRRYRHLTVYPLLLSDRLDRLDVLTLDEALIRGVIDIRETDAGTMSTLRIRHHAAQPVFLMAGEILLGGKQDRILRDDVLLPPRSGWVEVPVYCGERDRWQGKETSFRSDGALVPPSLRGMTVDQAGQEQVWREIDRQLDTAGVSSPTRRYQEVIDHAGRQGELDRCVAAFSGLPDHRTVGCVVLSGHRILGADLFSDPDLFRRLWPKVSRSYAIENLSSQPLQPLPTPEPWGHGRRLPPWPQPGMVREFLDRISATDYRPAGTPGLGQRWNLSGPVVGSSLEQADTVVHAAVFPRIKGVLR